jgi:quinol monooxygenase YgiN
MPYIRLTLARPRPERMQEVRRHYEDLVAHLATLPGFITGWVVEPEPSAGEIGRLSVWETPEDAHRAANDPHAMALHAELEFDLGGNLWDRSFAAYGPTRA